MCPVIPLHRLGRFKWIMSKLALKTKLINMILFVVSLLFAMLISEIFLRIYLKDDYSVPSHRDWLFRKNWDEKFANLNSLGHRDHEFSVHKSHGIFRILAIGDSFTYGDGIKRLDDIYTEILEKKLNKGYHKPKFEVLNIAQKGWGAKDYLLTLRKVGLSYEPDLVMIGFYLNDIEASPVNRPRPLKIIPKSIHWIFSRVSYVYWYLYSRIHTWMRKKDILDYYLSYTSSDSFDWKRFVSFWKQILATCSNNNIRTVVVIFPHPYWLNDDDPFITVYQNVENLSKDNGGLVLNLFPFLKGSNPPELWVGITDSHPNEKAHQIYADRIYEFLKKENIVPEFH